jgi:enoyl-CoA hydratase/carnithine racemase
MAYEFIRQEAKGRVTTLTLNRPQAMNAINPAMHFELQDAFDVFAADPEQFICIVTGAGDRAFCAGSDLKAGAGNITAAVFTSATTYRSQNDTLHRSAPCVPRRH